MPNTVIPGFEEVLGPALASLTSAVGQHLRPNALFQKEMQKRLATDPELVVKLAGIAAKDPTVLAKMGFSETQVSEITPQESAAAQVDRTKRPEIVAAAGTKLAAETSTDKLTAQQNTAVSALLTENPSMSRQWAEATVKGPVTREKLGEQAVQANDYSLSLEERRKKLIANLPSGPVDMLKHVNDLQANKGDWNLANSYMADPNTAPLWQAAWNYSTQLKEIEARKQAQKDAKADTVGEKIDAKQSAEAYGSWMKSANAGTTEAWKAFTHDPATQLHAADLLSGKAKSAGYEDDMLLEVAEYAAKNKSARFNRDALVLGSSIVKSLTDVEKGVLPDASRGTSIIQMNQNLKKYSKLTGQPEISVKWVDTPMSQFWTRDHLEFSDSKGHPVDPDKVSTMLATPPQEIQLAPNAQTAYSRINNLKEPGTLQAALAAYEASDDSPNKEDSKLVRQRLMQEGRVK